MRSIAAFFTFTFLTTNLFASVHNFFENEGNVTFVAKGRPSLISIKGQGVGVVGSIQEQNKNITGEIKFNLDSLKTGIELRDDHLKNKYLEVAKYSHATLKFTNFVLPQNLSDTFTFQALLNLHGVEKLVSGEATIQTEKENKKIVEAKFQIKLSDFKIDIPSFQGITVAEDVKVQVNLPFESVN